MRIAIAERLRPFIHRPGSFCILPGSTLRLQVFPALLRVHDLAFSQPKLIQEIPWNIQGPLKDFTIQQDLERGCVRIWGHSRTGFVRYTCRAVGQSDLDIQIEKNPQEALPTPMPDGRETYQAPAGERLSLGCHKAQDWEMIQRRLDMAEIFPHWFRLGQLVPHLSPSSHLGTLALLREEKTPEAVIPAFEALFLAGFEGLLSPRLQDEDHHGLHLPASSDPFNGSPLQLLTSGAALIRGLFVKQDRKEMHLLPCLPPEFHCGRFIGIQWPTVGVVDLEWSKKTLRRLILHCETAGEVRLCFPKALKSFRIRKGNRDRGRRLFCCDSIVLLPNAEYYLDNFQH